MNDRAREILAFIQRYKRENQMAPSIREVGDAFHIRSTNGVRYYLTMLQKAGLLDRRANVSRGIRTAQAMAGIPILGRVAAGQPITAEQCYEGSLDTAEMFGTSGELFALRVRGDSMIDAGILEGDYVVVRRRERADSGQMVVALVDGEATVKYYRPLSDRIELVPANENYQPIVVEPGTDFQVLGIVSGVIRTIGR
jgi:repressor LexA